MSQHPSRPPQKIRYPKQIREEFAEEEYIRSKARLADKAGNYIGTLTTINIIVLILIAIPILIGLCLLAFLILGSCSMCAALGQGIPTSPY